MVKSAAWVKTSLRQLHWISERIIQTRVPAEIQPLIFERKLVGLCKRIAPPAVFSARAAVAAASTTRSPCLWAREDLEVHPAGPRPQVVPPP